MTTPALIILLIAGFSLLIIFLLAEHWADESKAKRNRRAVDRFLDGRDEE